MKRLLLSVFAVACLCLPAWGATGQVRIVRNDKRISVPVTVLSTEGDSVLVSWQKPLQLCGHVTFFNSIPKDEIDRAVSVATGAEVNLFRRMRKGGCDSGSCNSSGSCSTSNNSKANPVSLLTPPNPQPQGVTATQPATGNDMNVDAFTEKLGTIEKQIADIKSVQDKTASDIKTLGAATGSMATGAQGPAGPAGPQGPAGDQGDQGKPGNDATVDVDSLASAVLAKLPKQPTIDEIAAAVQAKLPPSVSTKDISRVVDLIDAQQKQIGDLQKVKPVDSSAAVTALSTRLSTLETLVTKKATGTVQVRGWIDPKTGKIVKYDPPHVQ